MDQRLQKNTVPPKTVKRLIRRSPSQKGNTKGESGNCNVCSAPCSSCMHLNVSQMGLKKNEFSDENDSAAVSNQYFINEDKKSDSLQCTHSEASNLLSVNSSHDSYYENIESKSTARPSYASEDVGILRTFSNKYDGPRGTEGHDDSSSCASRASDVNAAFSHCNKDLDSKKSSRSSVSVCSLGSGKVLSSQKVDLSELPSVKEVDVGCGSLRIQSDKSAVGVGSEISTKIHLKSEADIDGESLDKAGKSLNEDEHGGSNELVELPRKLESLQAASGDESCESVALEHDVKVCDICGDAGREDLLAICSKCADGAEHTYCMREMIQKVPEGDWLCEECKLAEETKSQKQGLGSEGKKANRLCSYTQILGKRDAEHLEGASAPKKHAVEPNMGLTKSLSPSKVPALSREGSFKNLDKGKLKSSPKLGNHSGNDMLETVCSPTFGSRLQSPRRTLLKSNSFNALNSKPKVKLVDEIALQKKKIALQKKEIARQRESLYNKEEASKVLGKSMSFKSTDSGRLNTGESKFKMLSFKYPPVQDLKGLKQVKERISLDRKNLSKLDRSCCSVSTPKVDQKLTPHTDTISHSSASNSRATKSVRSDGKPSMLSRSISNVACKVVENAVTSDSGVPSANGCISSEQKLNQVNLKDEPSSSSSWTAERQPSNIDGIISDGLSSTNQSEKIGYTAEYCSVSQVSGADLSAPRNLREEINKGNKLKTAIETAMCLRPGICKRTSQDPSSVSVKAKNMISVEDTHESQTNLHNRVCNMKLLDSHSTDAVISPSGEAPPLVPLVAESAIPKTLAIPEHEYIWQGAFQVHKMGKTPEFCGGIQAHLSTLASPKVLEVVNSFPLEVPLNEVPRLSTWPTQFHNGCPKEDNIALYFFAKDLESYEKYYKVLLDNMVKNDLALKGDFEGVEFLIFSSTQLPQNCQVWNTLLFLWGVFKGRRSSSSKSVCIPDASMVRLDGGTSTDICQPTENDSTFDSSCNVVVTSAVENTCISTERVGDYKVSSFEKTYVGIKANLEEQDGKIDTKYLSRIATGSMEVHPDMKSNSPLEGSKVPDCRLDTELKPCLQATEIDTQSFEVKKGEIYVQEDHPSLKDHPTQNPEAVTVGKIDGESVKIRESRDANVNTYSKRDISCWQWNHQKRPYLDLTEPVPEMSTDASERMPWSVVKSVSMDGGSDNKRMKAGFSGIYQYSSARDEGSFSDSAASGRHGLCYRSSLEEKRCDIAYKEKVDPVDMGSRERFFFPMVSDREREFLLIKDEGRVADPSPNLELALGAEMRPPNKGILPFFVGTADKSDNLGKEKEEVDDESASLSLSLSFPFPETGRNAKSVTKTEQLFPESDRVNTSLLLFGGFHDK